MGAVVLEVVAVITSDVYDIALCYKQRICISDRRVSPPLRCPEEALTQPLSALSAASYNTCPSV